MDQRVYYATTVAIILVQVYGACKIDFIFQIIPWTSIVSSNCQEFLFPSVFYLVAARRYGNKNEKGLQERTSSPLKVFICTLNIILGVTLFTIHFL